MRARLAGEVGYVSAREANCPPPEPERTVKRSLVVLAVLLGLAGLGAYSAVGRWSAEYERALFAGEFDRAGAALDKLAWLGNDSAERRMTLAHAFAADQNLPASEAQLLRHLELSPTSDAWDGLGFVRTHMGDWEGVIEAHEGSRAAGGGRLLLRHATQAWVALGDREAALQITDTATRDFADSAEVQVQAAGLATELEDAARATRYYEQALSVAPERHYVANNLAWFYATEPAVSDPERALELARRALAADGQGSNPNYLETLARSQWAAGRRDDAVATAQRAAELAEDPALRQGLRDWIESLGLDAPASPDA